MNETGKRIACLTSFLNIIKLTEKEITTHRFRYLQKACHLRENPDLFQETSSKFRFTLLVCYTNPRGKCALCGNRGDHTSMVPVVYDINMHSYVAKLRWNLRCGSMLLCVKFVIASTVCW